MIENKANIPGGFSLPEHDEDATVLQYRSTGMGSILVFVSLFLLVFGLMVLGYFDLALLKMMIKEAWWSPLALLCGLSAYVYFACFLLFHLFGVTVFSIQSGTITMTRKIAFAKFHTSHHRNEVKHIVQLKDGGEGDDSFHSWGLELVLKEKVAWFTHKKITLLSRQDREKSDWLGPQLASQLGVKFIAAK